MVDRGATVCKYVGETWIAQSPAAVSIDETEHNGQNEGGDVAGERIKLLDSYEHTTLRRQLNP